MSRRSRARSVAFQVLFQEDLNPESGVVQSDQMVQDELVHEDLIKFARGLIAGVRRCRKEIDEKLESIARNWTLERMAATDRNALRLATFEIMYTNTPGPVVVNEAINLAKRFGSAESSQFVNGILDKLLKEEQPDESSEAPRESFSKTARTPTTRRTSSLADFRKRTSGAGNAQPETPAEKADVPQPAEPETPVDEHPSPSESPAAEAPTPEDQDVSPVAPSEPSSDVSSPESE